MPNKKSHEVSSLFEGESTFVALFTVCYPIPAILGGRFYVGIFSGCSSKKQAVSTAIIKRFLTGFYKDVKYIFIRSIVLFCMIRRVHRLLNADETEKMLTAGKNLCIVTPEVD